MTDRLVEAIDAAAADLLARATAPGTDAEGKQTLVTLAERTKAFDSVVEWAKVKQEIAPPERGPSKFETMRSNFIGPGTGKAGRRRRAPDGAIEAESPGGINGAAELGDEPGGDFRA